MPASLTLAERLDTEAAAGLKADLLANLGQDLTLKCDGISHLGALCLQLLLSAKASWAEDGHQLTFEGLSTRATTQISEFGVSPDVFMGQTA